MPHTCEWCGASYLLPPGESRIYWTADTPPPAEYIVFKGPLTNPTGVWHHCRNGVEET